MTLRTTALILGLASLAGGCIVTPRYDEVRVYDERRVVYEDDAYEGYYYVRIVYLGGIPWYVDEDLQARPVPPHLRSHFRYGAWARSAPPSFGRDDGMRDGYRLSRIVYIDGVPHHVDEGRHARPIPSRLRSRFSYDSVARRDDSGRRPGGRPAPPFAHPGNEAHRFPQATGRDRQQGPAYGADDAPGRGMPPGYMREEARPLPPDSGRERQGPRAYEVENESRRGMRQARMREEGGRQDPSDARNGRGMPPPQYEAPSARGESRDERRGQPSHEVVQRERMARSAGDERRRGMDVADERGAEASPERKNGKGRGRNDDQEADAWDERGGNAGRRNRRDE